MADQTVKQKDNAAAKAGNMDPVVAEAQRRFAYCQKWEDTARKRFKEDYKFANGDSDNNYQWPSDVYADRAGAPGDNGHPCLTINKVRQHNMMIVNDAKRNKPGIKFSPVGNAATAESSNILNGLARHVEQQSNAPAIYDKATEFMVGGGFGFWRVVTDYKDTTSFDQEIYLRPILNPLNAWLDPNTIQPDKIDAKYGFLVDEIAKELFEAKYPRFKDFVNQDPFPDAKGEWCKEDTIRVAEYYRIVGVPDVLWAYVEPGKDMPTYIKQSMLEHTPELFEKVKASGKSRPIMEEKLEWYFLVGNKIADKRLEMPGKYVPIIKIAGEETIIDGEYDCKSHTRALKDAQRMYNYWASSAVEYGALQTKTPWIAAKESIEGNINDWNSANIDNKSVLQYNALADDGITPLPAPQRIQPPVSAPVALDGMKIADEQMMSASGQYQAMMGAPSNERSGKAIQERQRQGDTATYHFIDATAMGIRKTGKIMLDLFPKVYDSKRMIQIQGEDGKSFEVMIDPKAQQAYAEEQKREENAVLRIINPAIGQYDTIVDVGPSFGTKREEAFNAFMGLMGQAPQLIPVLGDILFRNGDFPMSEEAAERLKRMVPPHVLGEGPSMQEQQLMQQMDNLKKMLGELLQQNATLDIKLKGKDQQRVVDVYKAITERMKVELDHEHMSIDQVMALMQQTVEEAMGTPIDAVSDASEGALERAAQVGNAQTLDLPQNLPPQPGAKMGADGQWYGRNFANSSAYRPV